MKKYALLIFLGILMTDIARAGDRLLLEEVRAYSEKIDTVAGSEERTSLQALFQEGKTIADRLRYIIEQLPPADYEFIVHHMKGFLIKRDEVIIAEPDVKFFTRLAERSGMENDRTFFRFLGRVRPEGAWPVYVGRQGDSGGCIRYGDGYLSILYKEGKTVLPKVAGFYREEVQEIMQELVDQLTSAGCACGDRQSLIRELRLFEEINNGSEIVERVKERLNEVQKGTPDIKFHCAGGV